MNHPFVSEATDLRPLSTCVVRLHAALEDFGDQSGPHVASVIRDICGSVWFHFSLLGSRSPERASDSFLETLQILKKAEQCISKSIVSNGAEIASAIADYGSNLRRLVENEYRIPDSEMDNYRW